MKTITRTFMFITLAASVVWLNPRSCRGEIPSGAVVYSVTDPKNAVWDAACMADWKALRLSLTEAGASIASDVNFTNTGAGKLVGAGATQVQMNCPGLLVVFSNATYKVTGTISSKSGVATVNYNASVKAGAQFLNKWTTLTVTATRKVTLNAPAGEVKGKYINHASSSLHPKSHESGTLASSWKDLQLSMGDGSWSLALNLTNDTKTKLTGAATVTLNSGAQFLYTLKGTYSSSTGRSQLTLSPAVAKNGANLMVVLYGQTVHSISGNIAGQSIKL